MARLRSPIHWLGGKTRLASKIVEIIDEIPHRVYCEPFGGGASVLLAKRPSKVEVYNDIDSGLVNFFRVLADPVLFERFYELVSTFPFSRELYSEYFETWAEQEDPAIMAAQWFYIARQSFGGKLKRYNWAVSVRVNHSLRRWRRPIAQLPEIHQRLLSVAIEHVDWRHAIELYDSDETLFYLDPPYLPETRKEGLGASYAHELSREDHEELLQILAYKIKGSFAISGYENELYDSILLPIGCKKYKWEITCDFTPRTRSMGTRGRKIGQMQEHRRAECLWVLGRGTGQLKLPLETVER